MENLARSFCRFCPTYGKQQKNVETLSKNELLSVLVFMIWQRKVIQNESSPPTPCYIFNASSFILSSYFPDRLSVVFTYLCKKSSSVLLQVCYVWRCMMAYFISTNTLFYINRQRQTKGDYFLYCSYWSTGSSSIQNTQYSAHTLLMLYLFHMYLPSVLLLLIFQFHSNNIALCFSQFLLPLLFLCY